MYIVLEIQTNSTVGTLVSSYENREQAESAYHTILASAALSSLPCHAAVLLTERGGILASAYYEHEV